jgi:site-specific DNA-methyltransferase (adenine-specific)
MKSELIKISLVKANPNNPRTIKDDKFKKLVESIKAFPKMLELRPIVVNDDMIVLGGNMRLKACKEAGLKEVWVIKASNFTEQEQKEFIIKDNGAFGEWDFDDLRANWNLDELEEWGLDMPELPEVLTAEDDNFEEVDVAQVKTDIVLGDVIEIGPHRLLCGSSTETDSWEKIMSGELADLVVTDPPYNVDYQGGDRTEMKKLHRRTDGLKIQNDSMSDDAFYKFLYDFYTALGSYTKPGGAWYVWHADMETVNFRTAMVAAGLLVKQNLIWVKDVMVMGRQDYHWQHEPCLYGWKEGAAHSWHSDRKQTTILKFERPRVSKEHPTMKPVPLIAYQIENSSKVGDIVADGFGGSGTTMIAAHQLKRVCRMTELDPRYCQVIMERMAKADSSLEIKINGKPWTIQKTS